MSLSLSRRQFVYVASLSAVATSAAPSLLAQNEGQAARDTFTEQGTATLATLSLQDFEGLIGARFSISLSGQSLGRLTLVAATAADPVKPSNAPHVAGQFAQPAPGRTIEGFSLRFQGAGAMLPQDTYLMEENSLGAFPLFIVPASPAGSHRPIYLATFTRFADPAPSTPIALSE